MNNSVPQNKKILYGQSIIEVVISIGIATLVIAALVILGTVSLRTTLSSARRAEATRLAISGLEAMRYYRDNNGFTFTATDVTCYEITSTSQIEPMTNLGGDGDCSEAASGWQTIDLSDSSSKTIFKRQIKVTEYGSGDEQNRMRFVTSIVRWSESGGETIGGEDNQRAVTMSVVLSDW